MRQNAIRTESGIRRMRLIGANDLFAAHNSCAVAALRVITGGFVNSDLGAFVAHFVRICRDL
jgi:hypothetical protein